MDFLLEIWPETAIDLLDGFPGLLNVEKRPASESISLDSTSGMAND